MRLFPPHNVRLFAALLPLLVLLALVSSCGQKKGALIYDTEKNPDHFPDAALALVRDVQEGNLESAGQIQAAFIDLYERLPWLLDNQPWKAVVAKLGTVFRERGDQLSKQGLAQYSEASLFYHLAASAHSEDERLTEGSRLFSAWDRAVESGLFPADVPPEWLAGLSLTRRIDILKQFVFSDSTGREFAKTFLASQLIDEALLREKAEKASVETISRGDSAFLSYLGKIKGTRMNAIASFDDPGVDLVACQMLYHQDSVFAIETYFRPNRQIKEGFEVALNLARKENSEATHLSASDFHIEFPPVPSPLYWEVGKIAMAVCTLKVSEPVGRLTVSLIRKKGLETTYLPVAGTGAHQVTIAPSVRLLNQ
jgi:hypothetical protein